MEKIMSVVGNVAISLCILMYFHFDENNFTCKVKRNSSQGGKLVSGNGCKSRISLFGIKVNIFHLILNSQALSKAMGHTFFSSYEDC